MKCKECKKKDEIIQSQKNMVSGFLHSIGNTIFPIIVAFLIGHWISTNNNRK